MKITNVNNLPAPFVSAVEREYQYKDKQYSATQLLKGTCEAVLERRHHDEIQSDVSDMIWLIFGTAVHSILENAEEEAEQLKENKIVIDVDGGYKLSGIFDLYDAKEKKVTDYKTATVWKVIYNDWDDYRKQLLIYAYMLKKIGFECNKGEIIATLKDHSKSKAKFDGNYPQFPIHKVSFNFIDEDFKEIERFIKNKFNEIKLQEALSDDKLIPCTDVERWHKDDKYAVMKEGRKSALKVCSSKIEANEYIVSKNLDSKHYIEFREGQDTKCDDYCNVKQWCPFYKAKLNKKGSN
ncbi:MAG: hypothetical protein DBY38_02510 [Clostridium cadaveris]|uniref:PD-(D/E)XK endonuclease-like domain-containing protein n=1 Tax=Clostridium cadaveris TaxID=1529 RepID=A0A316MF38_9CLOT|nr:MAG: hypothetical protein DBY38_02510 [Clostridium cadaveris]